MNRECLPAVPKPRKRRATDAFETKGMPLADLLEHDTPFRDSYRPAQRSLVHEHSNGSPPQHSTTQHNTSDHFRAFQKAFSQGLALDDKSASYLLAGVDPNFAGHCCEQFRHISACFPFVEAPYMDPMALVSTRPVTLVAICTVASGAHPDLRSRLSEAFRHVLATRCIVEGEQSLDLMVGLLIYLAWHHQYFGKQQIYQYLCLLAGMVTDLGLHKTPSLAEQARGVPEPEIQKAFIGAYYLSSSLSFMGFNKPSPLSWCSSLDHAASALNASTAGREANLQPYVDLAHLLEDHAALLTAAPTVNPSSYVDLATRSSLARLSTLQRAHSTAPTALAFAAVSIHVNARALTFSSSGPPGAVLMQTAVALKDYLDSVLLCSPITLHHFAITDWTNLLVSLLLVSRLSSPTFLSSVSKFAGFGMGWESSSLASMLSPDTTFDRVCNHMAVAPNDQRQGSRQEGLLSWLRSVCDTMKRRVTDERHDSINSPFDAVSNMSRDRRPSNVGPGFGHDDGRFRAVNSSPKQHAPVGAIASPWSPTAATDLGFGLFGGIGLLDESFWAAFNSGATR